MGSRGPINSFTNSKGRRLKMEDGNGKVLSSGINMIHLIVSIIALAFALIYPPLSIGWAWQVF